MTPMMKSPPITNPAAAQPASAQPQTGAASLTPAGEAAAPAEPPIQQIIKPYMGKEQVMVQVSLNLVHFAQPKAQEPSED